LDNQEIKMKAEINNIWKALTNLDKADIQTAALCHAIVTLLTEKGVGSQEEIAEEMKKSIPKIISIRSEIADAMSDPHALFHATVVDDTVH
jgi:hypothetical protein